MSVFENVILYGLLFLALLLIADGALSFVFNVLMGKGQRINQRLQLREEGKKNEDIQKILKTDNSSGYSYKRFLPFYSSLYRLIYETNSQVTVERLYGLMAMCAFVWVLVLQVAVPFFPFLLKLAIAVVAGSAPIVVYMISIRSKKLRHFEAQLPDALDLIVRSLRIGHPLSSSIEVVAKEMPDPIGSEFGLTFDEISYGKEVPEAIQEMSERVPVPDLKYLSVAVQIHYESGGNLAEILSGLSAVIRDRFRMFRKVHALTAEGRLSAWFLSLFPILLIGMIQLVKPDYYAQVYDFPYFKHMVVLTVLLLGINIIAMRMITAIKV